EVKINCGAVAIGATGKAGVGVTARNHLGDVLGLLTKGLDSVSHCWKVANFSAFQAAKMGVSLPVGNLETFLRRPHFLTKIEEPNVCYFRFT
ncbi:hypothetical protein GIB67_017769, partial [Kingdonia uniflora]